jgi:hypothetical protein
VQVLALKLGKLRSEQRDTALIALQRDAAQERRVFRPEEHSQRRTLRVFSAGLSGDRGKTAAAAEGPWGVIFRSRSLQGLSQSASPSRTSQTDQAQAQCIGPSIVNSDDRDNAPGFGCPAHHSQACTQLNAAAYADELGTEA